MIFTRAANQRAGAWYVKPSDEKAHAYFKCALPPPSSRLSFVATDSSHLGNRSTDGHANEHNFNLRRELHAR